MTFENPIASTNNSIKLTDRNLTSFSADTDYSLWKATRNFRRAPIKPLPPLQIGSEWVRDDNVKVELYAQHLEKCFMPHDIASPSLPPSQNLPDCQFSFSPKEVATVIDRLNVKKAPGADRITARMLRELPRLRLLWLTRIYNSMLRLRYIPANWKRAKVIMLHKPGKQPNLIKSYRPISLLSVLNKVFEKLLHKKLLSLLPSTALPNHQFGFRAHHSTTDQLHRVTTTILQSLEKKQFCAAAFLDVAQAFDRVWHAGLLYKIRCLLPSNVCDLLQNYLSNRTFFVTYGMYTSTTRPISAGVPQGSVLGPLLYSLFTADIPATIDQTVVATFADDTAFLALSKDYLDSVNTLQGSLDIFHEWTTRWKIKVSSEKSTHVVYSLHPHGYQPVEFDRDIIPYASSAKYLGVHLDERLTFRQHIERKRKELDLRLNKLRWLLHRRSALSISNKRLLYMATLRPVWAYALPIWGCAANSLRNIIQRFQNKALRLIAGAPWYVRNDSLHADLRVPTINEVIKKLSSKHERRLHYHPNELALSLLDNSTSIRRLCRRHPVDLA